MKTLFSVCALALLFAACGGKKPDNNTSTTTTTTTTTTTPTKTEPAANAPKSKTPFDFPVLKTLAAKGDEKTFIVDMTELERSVNDKKSNPNTTYSASFRNSALKSVGEYESEMYDGAKIPNELIYVVPKGQTAKVGDIVAGKWSGVLKRAIVINADNPSSPKVKFLNVGESYGKEEQTLDADAFEVISKPFASGSCCAYKDPVDGRHKLIFIYVAQGDKVMGFHGTELLCVDKSQCTPVPVKPDFKVGDEIQYPFVSVFSKGVVTAIDEKNGIVSLKGLGGSATKCSFGEVIKTLN
jgi:hypothetical protein